VVSDRSGREIKMYSAPRSVLAVAVLFMSSLSGSVAFPQAVNFIRRAASPQPLVNAPLGPAPRDLVQEDLATMGKTGRKILRARARVLEILQTENACSAWFREKDSNPADIFRTLRFELDRQGEEFVRESRGLSNTVIYRNPYVARVVQGDGPYATITINTNGAFFRPVATVVEIWKESGPLNHRSRRLTNVGPYGGDTVHAQVLVLLHEFGHVLELLPVDENNVDGKSVQNTNEVLRFCRAEIESKVRRDTLLAAR
jgi:hypothetical protein